MPNAYEEAALQMRGQQLAQMIHAAAELGIADRVGDGIAVTELATAVDAVPDLLARMLRSMAVFGFFTVDREGVVTHTEKSRVLCSDSVPTLHFAARFWGMESMWTTWGKLTETLRTGRPAFQVAYGVPNFTYLAQHPEQAEIFDAFMQHSPDDRHAAVAEAYDFGRSLVVDVGGGSGGLIAAILQRHPQARGIVADQEAVVAAVPDVLGSLMSRCTAAPTDFFQSVPEGADLYTMAQILHDWNDEQCLRILASVRRAIPADARLLVIERVFDEDPTNVSPLNRLGDMQMMALFPGARERTLSEFRGLLGHAGFNVSRHLQTRSGFGIVEATPTDTIVG